jgi:hypothetical protein
MDLNQDEKHAAQVDAWLGKTAKGLPADRLVTLFGEAIHAIHKRTLMTLSEVTLNAILDRVLYQSQKKFPILSGLKMDSLEGVSLSGIMSESNGLEPARVTTAFRFFVIELLTILENLTAGILTEPLYKELANVKAQGSHSESKENPQSLDHSKRRKDREDI